MKLQTLFLKLTVVVIGIPILVLCILGLPWLVNNPVNPDYAYILYPVIIGMYVTAIPFFFVLYQTFKLLGYIDRNEAFSESSAKALKNIKYSATIIGIIYGACMPFIYLIAEKDDAPGLILIGLVFTFAPIVIAVFADVLKKLLEDTIDNIRQ